MSREPQINPTPPSTSQPSTTEGSRDVLSVAPTVDAPAILPKTNTSVGRTSPIAKAIRSELRILVEPEVLEFEVLSAVILVARNGRALLAVRNPTMRFDAREQGLERMENRIHAHTVCGSQWSGPAVLGASDRRKKDISDALRCSPLAISVRAELLELADTEPFGPSELLQMEQLATHAHRVLCAAMGLPSTEEPQDPNWRMMSGNGPGDFAAGPLPSSSQETFGASVLREHFASSAKKDQEDEPEKIVLAIACARKNGLSDLADQLEKKLGLEPTQPDESGERT